MDKEFNYIVSSSETVRWFPSKISSKDRLVARPFSLPESIHNKMLYEKNETDRKYSFHYLFYQRITSFHIRQLLNRIQASIFTGRTKFLF